MDIELVKQTESANDGQTIHLFYDDIVGMYLAFGLSAFYTTMILDPCISYSNALKMPVTLLDRNLILILPQSVTKVEHRTQAYYRFYLRSKVGTAGYERWMSDTLGDRVGTSKT